jgi:triacylglycerol esterase/lipase EstA (alpha/beta hydrolase family)
LTLKGNQIEKKANLKNCKDPVLLIYGFWATRRTFSILEKRLQQDGFTVISLNLGGFFNTFNTRAIEQLAALIDEKVEKIYDRYKIKGKLSIIAHSKGGLIGRYYVKRLGGDQRVKTLITLGTAHQGNPWAMLARFSPLGLVSKSLKQMAPLSSFLMRLKEGPFPKKVKLYSFYSKDDRICLYPNAVLEEAENVINVEVEHVSHPEFLVKKNVYGLIHLALIDQFPRSVKEKTKRLIMK